MKAGAYEVGASPGPLTILHPLFTSASSRLDTMLLAAPASHVFAVVGKMIDFRRVLHLPVGAATGRAAPFGFHRPGPFSCPPLFAPLQPYPAPQDVASRPRPPRAL